MHTYVIRLMGDCLVEVQYTVRRDGSLGIPQMPQDSGFKAQYAQIDAHWLSEIAYTYMRGYNKAIYEGRINGA